VVLTWRSSFRERASLDSGPCVSRRDGDRTSVKIDGVFDLLLGTLLGLNLSACVYLCLINMMYLSSTLAFAKLVVKLKILDSSKEGCMSLGKGSLVCGARVVCTCAIPNFHSAHSTKMLEGGVLVYRLVLCVLRTEIRPQIRSDSIPSCEDRGANLARAKKASSAGRHSNGCPPISARG